MKISIGSYGVTHTIETEHDDLDFDEFMSCIRAIVCGIFSEELWNDYLGAKDEED